MPRRSGILARSAGRRWRTDLSSEAEDSQHACNVTDEASVAAAVFATVERFGRLNVQIACSGHIGPVTPLADVTDSDSDIVIDVNNAKDVWLSCEHPIRAMRPRRVAIAVVVGQSSFVVASARRDLWRRGAKSLALIACLRGVGHLLY